MFLSEREKSRLAPRTLEHPPKWTSFVHYGGCETLVGAANQNAFDRAWWFAFRYPYVGASSCRSPLLWTTAGCETLEVSANQNAFDRAWWFAFRGWALRGYYENGRSLSDSSGLSDNPQDIRSPLVWFPTIIGHSFNKHVKKDKPSQLVFPLNQFLLPESLVGPIEQFFWTLT